jgi:hypothetical protein
MKKKMCFSYTILYFLLQDFFLMKDVQIDGTKSVLFRQRQAYRLDLTATSGKDDLIIALSFYGTRKII